MYNQNESFYLCRNCDEAPALHAGLCQVCLDERDTAESGMVGGAYTEKFHRKPKKKTKRSTHDED